jgi:hypothetical protein
MWALTKLASREMALSLSCGRQSESNKRVFLGGDLDGIWEGGKFDVRGGTVGVSPCIFRGTFDGFGIRFYGGGVVSCFEEGVALFAGFVGLGLVDVGCSFVFCLHFFRLQEKVSLPKGKGEGGVFGEIRRAILRGFRGFGVRLGSVGSRRLLYPNPPS